MCKELDYKDVELMEDKLTAIDSIFDFHYIHQDKVGSKGNHFLHRLIQSYKEQE